MSVRRRFALGGTRPDQDRTRAVVGRHQSGTERMAQGRIVEADGEKIASGLAGALPGGSEFDCAGRALDDDAVSGTQGCSTLSTERH
jgi:hypothetical protein